MKHELLDDEFTITEYPAKAKPINWTSILILWMGIGYCIFNGLLGEVKVIIAIVLLVISTAVTQVNYKLGVRITLGVILIGVFNLVDFFPIKYFFSFGIQSIALGFELVLFAVALVHYFTNRIELSGFFKDLFDQEVPEEEIQAIRRLKIDGFKKRFADKSIAELEMIVESNHLVPEAVEAARELIEESEES